MSILCILSSILEACSQISFRLPLLGSFLIQSEERAQAPHPITHPCCSSLYLFPSLFIFSEHWSVELYLVFQTRSCYATEALSVSAGNPLGDSCLHLHGCIAFELMVIWCSGFPSHASLSSYRRLASNTAVLNCVPCAQKSLPISADPALSCFTANANSEWRGHKVLKP